MKTIAVFDDDEDILSICAFILEDLGWKVFTFSDCNHVCERVSKIAPDAILMDNWIPDSGGVAATQSIKSDPTLSNIPVILFSANSDLPKLAELAGTDGYLEKPFGLDELETAINKFVIP